MSAPGWKESLLAQAPCRLIVGGAFTLAAYMKLFHRTWEEGRDPTFAFAEAIKAYDILDPVVHHHALVTAAYVVPWMELIVGVLLLVGFWTRPAALVSVVMLVGFTAINASVIYRGMDVTCSCFGDLEWPCTGGVGWCHVVRNAGLLVMAAYVLWRGAGLLALEAPGSGTKAGPVAG